MHKNSGSFTLPPHPETALPSTPSTNQEGTSSDNRHLLLKPLRSKDRVQVFLNAIREDFLNKVNVLEPGGFADQLIERSVLTETDNESIGAVHLPTPKEKARRVWTILYGIRHEVFVRDVLPVLCERHSHIIPESFWSSTRSPHDSRESSRRSSEASVGAAGGGCTRCEMSRLRPSTLADFLLKAGVMSFEVYSDITRNQRIKPSDYVWDTIFREFTKLSAVNAQRLQQDMTSLLTRHSLRVPDDIVDLMTEGFPCSCCCSLRSGTATRSMLSHLKKLSLRRPSHDSTGSDTSSSTVDPSSETDVSISNKSADSESLLSEVSHAPSSDLCDVAMPTRHPISSSVPEMTSSSNTRLSDRRSFFGELADRVGPDSPGLFLSGGAATGKSVPRSKREQVKMYQTWHGRRNTSELKLGRSEFGAGCGSTENLKNTIAESRESLVSQVLRELDDAKNLKEAKSSADIKPSISDITAACVQSPSGNNAVKISSDCQSQSQSVKVTTKTKADSHSVIQSGITETKTNSDSYSVSQSDSTDVKRRTDSQSVSQPLMIETESKIDSQLPSPTPHKGDPAADGSSHTPDISYTSKRQIAAPPPLQLKPSSTFTAKSGSAEQSSPRSSSGSRAVSSEESPVKLSSVKRQADVPSSLQSKASSTCSTKSSPAEQSSLRSSTGSRAVSSEENSEKLSSAKRQADVPSSLQSKASSTCSTKSSPAEQSSLRSSTGSRAVSSEENSEKLSSAKRQADVPSSLQSKAFSTCSTKSSPAEQSSLRSSTGSRAVSSEENSEKLSSAKRQADVPPSLRSKASSTCSTQNDPAKQPSPRSSTSSRACSSKESSVKLSSAKWQANVPSLPLKSSSDIAAEDLCIGQISLQSPAGSSVSSEGSSMKLSSPQSLASPVSLFSSASSDDEKLKNFRKVLTKGNYERHRSVLHGTAPTSGQDDDVISPDDVISHDDVISLDDVNAEVFFNEEDESTSQPDSSGGDDQFSRFNRLSDALTSLDQRSKEGSHAGQDDFISQTTVERAEKNRDLHEFRSIVASDVNSAEKLREKYSQAVITDDTAKEEIGQLLQNYTEMELLHSEIAEKLKTTTDRLRPDAEEPNSSPDTSEKAVSSEMSHLSSHIQDLCDDMLVSTRTFLLCAFHLNTHEQLTSQRTRTETEIVVHDVMVLLQLTSLEAWQSVQRLDELTDQLRVGGASEEGSSLQEVVSLLRSFLENS